MSNWEQDAENAVKDFSGNNSGNNQNQSQDYSNQQSNSGNNSNNQNSGNDSTENNFVDSGKCTKLQHIGYNHSR